MKSLQHAAAATLLALLTLASHASAEYVGVKYCLEPSMGGKCSTAFVQDAHEDIHACYNIPYEDNDKVQSFEISEGDICIFWKDFNCQSSHTRIYSGLTNTVTDLKGQISSFRCCRDTSSWCANGA
ncbi:hypothetical protein BU26DRAFT_606267 [Trematosphaeria pertusa]|uniref:Uncharacterized protein n=1 Tax=Trematosphaeria pertusa TaxID=390896 RepID=A0A6A6IAK8_9PLEO|nr:uncharacterized protein BU26DRAFT_606267 [Trematosphaeria pertusa]KAF2247289.1 hypothetical protein BU26DRAFT_606267 [Trematosphaeria pertusa]